MFRVNFAGFRPFRAWGLVFKDMQYLAVPSGAVTGLGFKVLGFIGLSFVALADSGLQCVGFRALEFISVYRQFIGLKTLRSSRLGQFVYK